MALTDEQRATLDALLQDASDDEVEEQETAPAVETKDQETKDDAPPPAAATQPKEPKMTYKKRDPDTKPDLVTPAVIANRRNTRIRYHMKKKGWDREEATAFVDGKVTPMMARESTLAKVATKERVKSIPNDLILAAEAIAKATAALEKKKAEFEKADRESIPEAYASPTAVAVPPKLVRQSGKVITPAPESKTVPVVKPTPVKRSTWGSNLRR